MSITWGSNKPTVSSRLWRGVLWALAWQAGGFLVVWFVLRHSSLWTQN